jgi:hypothetical protein
MKPENTVLTEQKKTAITGSSVVQVEISMIEWYIYFQIRNSGFMIKEAFTLFSRTKSILDKNQKK